jgi:hypothetical protein
MASTNGKARVQLGRGAPILHEQRKRRGLIVVGRCLVVQVGVAAVAQNNEVVPATR